MTQAARLWIKQFGLQRSGTNLAKAILETSCAQVRVLSLLLGDKHHQPDIASAAARARLGDIGTAVTDLDSDDIRAMCDAVDDGSLKILVCVREPITWMDSYVRYERRSTGRSTEPLDRSRLEALARHWTRWHLDLHRWCADSRWASAWVVHHEVVRDPQVLTSIATTWGAQCETPPERLGYLARGGDEHGSTYIGQRGYRAAQYRQVHGGEGLIGSADIPWTLELLDALDPERVLTRWRWDSSVRIRQRPKPSTPDAGTTG